MKRQLSRMTAGITVLAMALNLAACNSTAGTTGTESAVSNAESSNASADASSETTKADLGEEIEFWGVNDPQISSQQIIANELGYFAEEGVNVKFSFLQSGTDMTSMMAGGTAQIACEGQGLSTQLVGNGVGVTILAPVANCGGTQSVVAGPNTGIESSKDLEGKTIGMSNGAGVNMAIMSMCEEMGVDYDSLKFLYCDPSEQLAALANGDIDLMACWEPHVTKAVEQGGKLLFTGVESHLSDKTGPVDWMAFYSTIQVNDEFLATHKEEVKGIMRAMNRATEYINNNREEAVKIIAKQINVDEATVADIMSKNTYSMEWDTTFNSGIGAYANYMHEMGNLDNVPDTESYTDPSLLSEIDPSLVTFK